MLRENISGAMPTISARKKAPKLRAVSRVSSPGQIRAAARAADQQWHGEERHHKHERRRQRTCPNGLAPPARAICGRA